MNITQVEFRWLEIPLITPFKTALREVTHCKDLVVLLHTNSGAVGIGSAPSTPVITGDTHESIKAIIKDVIAPKLIGKSIEQFTQLCDIVKTSAIHNTNAKAALEIALYDLWGQFLQKPVYQILGGEKITLKSDITISLNSTSTMIEDCEKAIQRGFTELKIKVGKSPASDIETVTAIADCVGKRASLLLDVNQAWDAKTSVDVLQQLYRKQVELVLVEQPVYYEDLAGMAYVCQYSPYPIMADESAFNAMQLTRLYDTKAANIANIKLMKTGGLTPATDMVKRARDYDIPCMIGCMLEGPIGINAAAHLAVAFPDAIKFIDLDGAFLTTELPEFQQSSFGIRLSEPYLELTDNPGFGNQKMLDWLGA